MAFLTGLPRVLVGYLQPSPGASFSRRKLQYGGAPALYGSSALWSLVPAAIGCRYDVLTLLGINPCTVASGISWQAHIGAVAGVGAATWCRTPGSPAPGHGGGAERQLLVVSA